MNNSVLSQIFKKLSSNYGDDIANNAIKYIDDFHSPKEFSTIFTNKPQRIGLNDITPIETGDKSVPWKFDQSRAQPIIVDQHGQIMDGHHRFYAAKNAFDSDMQAYNTGDVPADYLENRWGNTDFGDINAVVVNRPDRGKGWAKPMSIDDSPKTYQELYDLFSKYIGGK